MQRHAGNLAFLSFPRPTGRFIPTCRDTLETQPTEDFYFENDASFRRAETRWKRIEPSAHFFFPDASFRRAETRWKLKLFRWNIRIGRFIPTCRDTLETDTNPNKRTLKDASFRRAETRWKLRQRGVYGTADASFRRAETRWKHKARLAFPSEDASFRRAETRWKPISLI